MPALHAENLQRQDAMWLLVVDNKRAWDKTAEPAKGLYTGPNEKQLDSTGRPLLHGHSSSVTASPATNSPFHHVSVALWPPPPPPPSPPPRDVNSSMTWIVHARAPQMHWLDSVTPRGRLSQGHTGDVKTVLPDHAGDLVMPFPHHPYRLCLVMQRSSSAGTGISRQHTNGPAEWVNLSIFKISLQ